MFAVLVHSKRCSIVCSLYCFLVCLLFIRFSYRKVVLFRTPVCLLKLAYFNGLRRIKAKSSLVRTVRDSIHLESSETQTAI